MGALVDLLFNVVCERGLHASGARVLWLARRRRVSLDEQMQHAVPDVLAGVLTWGLMAVTAWALWH